MLSEKLASKKCGYDMYIYPYEGTEKEQKIYCYIKSKTDHPVRRLWVIFSTKRTLNKQKSDREFSWELPAP